MGVAKPGFSCSKQIRAIDGFRSREDIFQHTVKNQNITGINHPCPIIPDLPYSCRILRSHHVRRFKHGREDSLLRHDGKIDS